MTEVRRLLLAAICSCVVACEGDTVNAELVLIDGGCPLASLAEVSIVSVEVYGRDDQGRLCTLSQRCTYAVDLPEPVASVEDLTDALRAASQPIIDTELEGASTVAVIGRRQDAGCFDEDAHPVCGFADVADIDQGRLEVVMRCDACPAQLLDYCP